MERFRVVNVTAEGVEFVARRTTKASIGIILAGSISGNLPILVGGVVGWGLSVGADELARLRIRHNLSSAQTDDLPDLEAGSSDNSAQ